MTNIKTMLLFALVATVLGIVVSMLFTKSTVQFTDSSGKSQTGKIIKGFKAPWAKAV